MLGELFLTLMATLIKWLSMTGFGGSELVFYRNLFGWMTLMPLLIFKSPNHSIVHQLKTQQIHLHLLRALYGLSAMYCFFYVIRHMPLAEASLLKLLIPLFLPLVAYLWLSERVSSVNIWALILALAGVMVILRPSGEGPLGAGLVGLMGALLAALAKVTIRRMGPSETSVCTVFYFTICATIVSAIPFAWTELNQINGELTPPSATQWGLLVAMGLMGTVGQILTTTAFRISSPGRVGPFTFISLLYAAFLGWLFFEETVTLTTLVGSGLILWAGWTNFKKG